MIDLHCHSHFSDGLLSPHDLVQLALQQQVSCLSLTDHDTLEGYDDLEEAAKTLPIKLIPGIELSCRWKKIDIHILGYQINRTPSFLALIARQNRSRIERAQEIGALLNATGVSDAFAKACKLAGHQRVGRPHFAALLVHEAKVKDLQSAFRQFLVRGRSAYVPTSWVSMEEAVAGIIEAGGQAVLAHPLKYGLTRSKMHELIKEFKDSGGAGMEVVSGEVTVSQINEMAGTSQRFDLAASSGSDFHGKGLSRMMLGNQAKLPLYCKPIWQQWTIF